MLWTRLSQDGVACHGLVEAGQVSLYEGDLFTTPRATGRVVPVQGAMLLPPLVPGKVVGLWNNFHALAAKNGSAIPDVPLYFIKATTSLLPSGGVIRPPPGYTGRVVYEGELGIVIGRRCTNVDEDAAQAAIFGYTCINDVTALDWLTADLAFPQWARAKGCDTFGPVGPVIATGLDWRDLVIRVALNGRERQNYPASDMILPPARIVALLSREMTLEPGDLIACGTSVGVLPMRAGMEVTVTIDGIGTLTNTYAG